MTDLINVYNLITEAQNKCIELYDTFESNIFNDINISEIKGLTPQWMCNSGVSPESGMNKLFFENLVEANKNEITNKILYSYDCETLIGALQDRLSSVEDVLGELYKHIPSQNKFDTVECENAIMDMGYSASLCFTLANAVFINLCSTFDILTKIAFEINCIHSGKIDFSNYPKMKSRGKLYGDRTKLNKDLLLDTVFNNSQYIRTSISIRDEIIHNGTWDYRPRIYEGNKGEEYDRWIMMPDFDEIGNFVCSRNRNKFYTKGDKMNLKVIEIVNNVIPLIVNTIDKIINMYSVTTTNERGIIEFKDDIFNWPISFYQIVKKKISI